MENIYNVGSIGFLLNNKIIKPNSKIKGLTVIQDNEEIKLTKGELQDLINEGYVIIAEQDKPLSKFEVGDLVRVKQISDIKGNVSRDEEYLKRVLKDNYNQFTNGVINSKEYNKQQNKWVYTISAPKVSGLGSESVYAVKIYGDIDGKVNEADLEPIDKLEFLVSFSLFSPGESNNTVKIEITK